MSDDLLNWLQKFYLSLCDGDWEHQYGFKIENIDNPGWMFEFELSDSHLAAAAFVPIKIERSEHDWIHCQITEHKFKGAGGPENLTEILSIFRRWVEANPPDASSTT